MPTADRQQSNRQWSDRIIRRTDPTFRHRWEVWVNKLSAMLNKQTVWIDVGCGSNAMVEEYGHRAASAIGTDVVPPERPSSAPFLLMRPDTLPFPDASADLITLRFVAEHLPDVPRTFSEIARVLRPGGRVMVLTTNTHSPFIILPRLLPFRLKNAILSRLFRVRDVDVMPTFHRLNTPHAMRTVHPDLELLELEFLQDANYTRRWIFLLFYAWHLATRPRPFRRFRTNLLGVWGKPH
ncbi:MAG: class I SAM-dependent methyltransferase [Chlorobi bacterium]|nr:class I SAM-dependent methyltransferase [Chlorobiota bacterium]